MKFKNPLIFLFLACLFGCTEESVKRVSTVKITRIVVNEYPLTNGAVPWDDPFIGSATGPDVSWKITGPQTISSGVYFDDTDGDTLIFNISSSVYLDKPSEQYTIQLWDIDDLDGSDLGSSDDLMKSLTFTPWRSEEDEDRDAIIVYDNNAEIIIDIEYLYE